MLPIVGVLNLDDLKRVNYLQVFFIASAVSMGKVLTATKSLDVLTRVLFGWMTPLLGHTFLSTLVVYWTSFTYHIFLASELSMLGTSVPPLMNYATAHHLNPLALGMIWTFACSGKIFVYQSAVLVLGYSFGYFKSKDLFRWASAPAIVDSVLLLLVGSVLLAADRNHAMNTPQRLIIGITGATGAVYGIRVLRALEAASVETHLIVSKWGARTLVHETPYKLEQVQRMASCFYSPNDQGAAVPERIVSDERDGRVSLQHANSRRDRARKWRASDPSRCRRRLKGAAQAGAGGPRVAAE